MAGLVRLCTGHAQIYTDNICVCVGVVVVRICLPFKVFMNLWIKKGGAPGRLLRVSYFRFVIPYILTDIAYHSYILLSDHIDMNSRQVRSAGLAIFRMVEDEETSEQKVEWLLLQDNPR